MKRLSTVLEHNHVNPDLIEVISTLASASKEIAARLQQGALDDVLGSAEHENVQGETQKKLDIISNDLIKEYLIDCGKVKALASEEEEEIVPAAMEASYLVCFDPLDGSSNIDINGALGTIFSILPTTPGGGVCTADFLQPGRKQVAAGYIMYGPSVMMALCVGEGVQMYTLDQRIGEFVQTVERVTIDAETKEFAINMSNQRFWAEPMQQYIGDLLAGSAGPRGKNFNMRWIAAMAVDVHRILCRGGLFTYPWDNRKPDQPGKLRLMYEANPMSYLIEHAGGEAWTDNQKILDIQPEKIHQRIPVILGSANEVLTCIGYHRR